MGGSIPRHSGRLQKHRENAENEGVAEYLNKLVHARIGHYVLVREIGRGTHYTLFQAVDPRLGRMVVIKILHVSSTPVAAGRTARATRSRQRSWRRACGGKRTPWRACPTPTSSRSTRPASMMGMPTS